MTSRTDTTAQHPARLTPGDRVTLARAGLGVVVAVLVALTLAGVLPPRSWLLVGVLVPTLLLDAVDGLVARRTHTVTARGARWDMEVDSAIVFVTSLAVVPIAPWALAIGLARYAFGLGSFFRPAWRAPLPYSRGRRRIAALQAVALATALVPLTPIWLAQAVTALALALLIFSFTRDVLFLERRWRGSPGRVSR